MVLLFDQFHLPEDVFEIVFATEQQKIVARMLFEEFKENGWVMGKTEMSLFANRIHDGTSVEIEEPIGPVSRKKKIRISYNKRQFYDRILTPMKAMGMVDYDLYKKKYLISEKFVDALKKISLMWRKELEQAKLG
ncbi:hypothetical protein HOK51_06825 [Candidatus Woesearchaeota archaeon]|jgi:hypothetical protein|nr:hypothetical protein [Candidatus Woesearchaeota archaeon]MBT6519536.1 hypothetical protein [Candidatus Woesearchaeota archaeon]MBT7367719.1 hypothetical protein [Candidatus Woesearchaeota archaeon]